MDSRAEALIKRSGKLFSARSQLDTLWQETAEHFYVERADFTYTRNVGSEFGDHLMSSYPLMVRRDLGNAFSSMLRRDEWFHLKLAREEKEGHEEKKWLEYATKVQRRAMYDRVARFSRATKEADHDFAAFGQCVISVEFNPVKTALLYRCWHLKDVAWTESYEGEVDAVFRKWKPSARELQQRFGKQNHSNVSQTVDKDPEKEMECLHAVLMDYEGGDPWMSIWIDVANKHVIEETPMRHLMYVIPRWQTVSGSPYAYSPATVAALPDARLLQSMTEVLLTAGEKFVDPPMLAVQEAIRSDVNIRRGGITWVDAEYDERLGEVLRPLSTDKSGLPHGFHLEEGIRQDLAEAFYLNKLTLPIMAGDMTATEVSQRVEEYIRQSLPLFEPMEAEYNGRLCDTTFEVLMQYGAFGATIPESLQDEEVEFRFEGPLQAAVDRKDAGRYREALDLTAMSSELDPTLAANVDFHKAIREAFSGVGVPEEWLRSEEEVAAISQAAQAARDAEVEAQQLDNELTRMEMGA